MPTDATPARERRFRGAGCKLASNCWRTIKGQHYEAWSSFPSSERIAEYRKQGVRCRRFGEELFVHTLDTDMAAVIDSHRPDWI